MQRQPATSADPQQTPRVTAWIALLLPLLAVGVTVQLGSATAAEHSLLLFGWRRLLAVGALATLPLAVTLASRIRSIMQPLRSIEVAIGAALIGLVTAVAVAVSLPATAQALDTAEAGFWPRAASRVALCLALELPWCLAAVSGGGFVRWRRHGPRFVWGVMAVTLAVVLPSQYALHLARSESALAETLLSQQRLVAAQRVLERLVAVGSDQIVGGRTCRATQAAVAADVGSLQRRLAVLDEQTGGAPAIEAARALAILEQPTEACARLAPAASDDFEAALLLAAILQHERRWAESSAWYETGLSLLRDRAHDAASDQARLRAYNGIAYNAREQGDYPRAEATYYAGLDDLPAAAAHFHFLLGRHYMAGGRPLSAIEHLERARQLDPATYSAATQTARAQLSRSSPGCLIGPLRGGH